MNKKLSQIALIVTIAIMSTITIALGIHNENNYEVIDIYGNRDELEDIVVAYQQRKGMYNTNEIHISKEGIEVKEYDKLR